MSTVFPVGDVTSAESPCPTSMKSTRSVPAARPGVGRSRAAPARVEASSSRRANELAFDNEEQNGSKGSTGHDSLSSRPAAEVRLPTQLVRAERVADAATRQRVREEDR